MSVKECRAPRRGFL